jgi:hypothetical protein
MCVTCRGAHSSSNTVLLFFLSYFPENDFIRRTRFFSLAQLRSYNFTNVFRMFVNCADLKNVKRELVSYFQRQNSGRKVFSSYLLRRY